jgi:hypothetical protein
MQFTIVAMLAATVMSDTCPNAGYDQCKGINRATGQVIDTAHECCPTDFKCVYESDEYSQCKPTHAPPPLPPSPPPLPAGQCAAEYAQCAGTGFVKEVCCPTDFKCVFHSDEYSQCKPTHAPPPTPPPPPPLPEGECASEYGQCAGRNFAKEVCCPTDFSCTKQSDFYSQCMPKAAPKWLVEIYGKINEMYRTMTQEQ